MQVCAVMLVCVFFFFQAEDGIRDLVRSRGLGDVYKRQAHVEAPPDESAGEFPPNGPRKQRLRQGNPQSCERDWRRRRGSNIRQAQAIGLRH
mgnify:CR=1 FL=1